MTLRRQWAAAPCALALLATLAACSDDPSGPDTGPPTLDQVAPNSVAAGDTVTLAGSNFADTPSGNLVRFGEAQARVIEASESSLRAVVPPCLAEGSLAVSVEVGSRRSGSVAVTYTEGALRLDLQPLEGGIVAGADAAGCLELPANGARYLLVPQFATTEGGSSQVAFAIGSAAGVVTAEAPSPVGPSLGRGSLQSRFDRALREYERGLRPERGGGIEESVAPQQSTPAQTRDFRVLCDLDPGSNCFSTVTAELKFAGANVLVYVDEDSPAGGFSDAELTDFGRLFDETLYQIDVREFGEPSDIDDNDRVIMLLSPVVNALAERSSCSTLGFVLGFFFGFDLSSRSSNSNRGEVFYGFVPDPQGIHSCAHTKEEVEAFLPATFIHEFQHMISYNYHVLEGGGEQEVDWLNEGLSHIAEEFGSRHYEDLCRRLGIGCPSDPNQLFPDSAQGFIREQLENSYGWLRATAQHSVTLFDTDDCCEERGASWLFLRYVGDRFDSTVYGRIARSSRTSAENVEAATGEAFTTVFGDFGIALFTDSLPGVARASIPARFRFTSRNLRFLYRRLNQQQPAQFPLVFPLVPTALPFGQALQGSMLPGTFAYYDLATPTGSTAVTIRFSTPSGDAFAPALHAQLGIFRLQ
jgi:hypothetical protein